MAELVTQAEPAAILVRRDRVRAGIEAMRLSPDPLAFAPLTSVSR